MESEIILYLHPAHPIYPPFPSLIPFPPNFIPSSAAPFPSYLFTPGSWMQTAEPLVDGDLTY